MRNLEFRDSHERRRWSGARDGVLDGIRDDGFGGKGRMRMGGYQPRLYRKRPIVQPFLQYNSCSIVLDVVPLGGGLILESVRWFTF